jgi:integrase
VKTKGGKPRTVPVNKELRSALQAYRTECRRTGDRRANVGERRNDVVSRSLRSAPWLDGVLVALRPADVRHTSGAQGHDGRRLTP